MSLPYRLRSAASPLGRPAAAASPLVSFANPRVGQQRRNKGGKGEYDGERYARENLKMMKIGGKSADPSMSQSMRQASADQFRSGSQPLYPSTFVSAPLSEYPKAPLEFLAYQWMRSKAWFTSWFHVLNVKTQSMDNWKSRPRFKARKGRIPPTAKAMYRDLLEAFAAGDRATIKNLATPVFAEKFLGAIARRSPQERTHFEMQYNSSLFYPRLRSYIIAQASLYDKNMLSEQAVVAISSKQRVSRLKASTGEVIPGSLKEQDKVENVVLMREVHAGTYEASPWRIWGTTGASTLEGIRKELKAIEKEQARQAGWKTD